MKQVTINLYSFAELSEQAKERAISEHGIFLDSLPLEYEDESGKFKVEYHEHSEEEIIDSINANEYIFFADGEIASCVTYTGGHPKAGKTELKFAGEIYTL